MKRDVQIIRDSIERIVSMLTARRLKVTQRGTSAHVSYHPKTGDIEGVNLPYIPDDASQEFIAAVQGFLDHEVGHVLYTTQAEVVRASKFGERVFNMANLIEDVYIERKMGENFRGSSSNLDTLRKFFFDKVCRNKMEECLAAGDVPKAQGYVMVMGVRAWGGQPFAQDMIKEPKIAAMLAPIAAKIGPALIAEIRKCDSSRECVDLARKMVKAMERTKPPAPPAPPPAPAKPEEVGDTSEPTELADAETEAATEEELEAAAAAAAADTDDTAPPDEDDAGDADGTVAAPADAAVDEDDLEDAADHEESAATPEAAPGEPDDDGDAGDGDSDTEADGEGGAGGAGESDAEPALPEPAGDKPDTEPAPIAEDDLSEPAEPEGGEGEGAGTDGDASPGGTPDGADSSDGTGEKPKTDSDPTGAGDSSAGDRDSIEGEGRDASEGSGKDSAIAEDEDDIGEVMDDAHDFDTEVSTALTEMAKREMKAADYRIFTSEFDVIEPGPECMRVNTVSEMVDETTAAVGVMQKHLERGMAAQNRKAWNPGLRRGRIAPGALFRTGVGDDRVFRQRTMTRAKNTAVELVVDCSGSMGGRNIHIAGTAAFALCSTLERLKIKNEAIGFTTTRRGQDGLYRAVSEERTRGVSVKYSRTEPLYLPIFKGFNERLDPKTKARFGALRESPGWLLQNIDGECVKIAGHRLKQQTAERHVMIVLSDGSPCASTTDDYQLNEHLKSTVKTLESDGIEVIGIGLNTNVVEHFYRKSLVLSDTSELATTLIGQLTKLLLEE